jgi:hypothetical protein
MKWFFRWLAKKLRVVWYDEESDAEEVWDAQAHNNGHGAFPNSIGMSFTLYAASGGHVLEFRDFAKEGSDRTRLYLINDTDDFAKQVSQCVTMESIRR